MHVRNEEAGAFAAEPEAELTGKLAVCAGSCGPGSLHLINGVYDAHRSAPVLAIVGHIPTQDIGTAYFQETHPTALFAECSHYCELLANPAQVQHIVETAIQHALVKGGVSAVLVLPGDVAAMESPADPAPPAVTRPVLRPADAEVERLAALLNEAKRVAVFAGIGCAGARGGAGGVQGAEGPGGPQPARQAVPGVRQPVRRGHERPARSGTAYDAAHACDAYLLLGTDFPYSNFLPTGCKIAQVDVHHRAAWAAAASSPWACAATWARPSAPCCPN